MPRVFERPATIALPAEVAGEGAALEGLFVPGESSEVGGAVIAPPHPQMGGSMESPVVGEIAHACQRAGFASLRFNWRGVGASAGTRSGDASVADEDYRAASAFVAESVNGPIVACGYSFGALAAVRATGYLPRIGRLVLIAPPPTMLDRDLLLGFAGDVFIACGDRDDYVDAAELAALAAEAKAAHLELIVGADHFFMHGLLEIGQAISSWWKPLGR